LAANKDCAEHNAGGKTARDGGILLAARSLTNGEREPERAERCQSYVSELDADSLRQVVVLDRLIALAGTGFERRAVENSDAAAAIANNAPFL
jgi:hypothetical protein